MHQSQLTMVPAKKGFRRRFLQAFLRNLHVFCWHLRVWTPTIKVLKTSLLHYACFSYNAPFFCLRYLPCVPLFGSRVVRAGVLRGVGGDALLPQMLFEGDELQGKKAPGEQVG